MRALKRRHTQHDYTTGVYIAGFDGYVKIGWSKRVGRRLRMLEDNLPATLLVYRVLGGLTTKDERALHRRFQSLRMHGEWFRLAPPLLQYLYPSGTPETALKRSSIWEEKPSTLDRFLDDDEETKATQVCQRISPPGWSN